MKPAIGCFGGTFNPPHTAHFALVQSALEQLDLAQILMIPAGQPWQKPHVLPAPLRVDMLRLTIESERNDSITLDTTEADLPTPSYTIDTLKKLRQRHPDNPLVWIMGSDQLANLHTWHDWQNLLNYAHIAVAQRAGHQVQPNDLAEPVRATYLKQLCHNTEWRSRLCGNFISFTLPALHVSSSVIREQIKNSISPHNIAQLAPAVAHYITQHHLYQGTTP